MLEYWCTHSHFIVDEKEETEHVCTYVAEHKCLFLSAPQIVDVSGTIGYYIPKAFFLAAANSSSVIMP